MAGGPIHLDKVPCQVCRLPGWPKLCEACGAAFAHADEIEDESPSSEHDEPRHFWRCGYCGAVGKN